MEVTKKTQKLSLAALIVSLLPLLTPVPVSLNITLPDGVRTAWAVCNLFLVPALALMMPGLAALVMNFLRQCCFPGSTGLH